MSMFRLICENYTSLWNEDKGFILEVLSNLGEVLLYAILLPVLPIIRALIAKRRVRDVKVEHFPKDYHEVISWEEEDEEGEY